MGIGNYSGTQQVADHNMFWTQQFSRIIWSGYGTVDNSPDTNLYLKRPYDNFAQVLYIPEGIYGGVWYNVVSFNSTGSAVVHDYSFYADQFYRASGGNATLSATGSTIATNCTITPTANTTVQGMEMIISDSDSEQLMYTWVDMRLWWADTLRLSDTSKWKAAGTSAAATVE